MNNLVKIGLIGASSVILGVSAPMSLYNHPANALEMNQGSTSFQQAPYLVEASATHTAPSASSTYKFIIEIPEGAGQPLQAVSIEQQANLETISFDLNQSQAYLEDGQSDISLRSIGGEEADKITVVFDQPVEPGSTVTVALQANQNPQHGGIYQFEVIAFPLGEDSQGLNLGSTRLSFPGSN